MLKIAAASALLIAAVTPALAHPGPSDHGSLLAGVVHPLVGLDHVLAMAAVGLWAAALGGRALWAMPGAFVAAMVGGFALGLAGLSLPAVEPVILASVVVVGLLVAAAVRLPGAASAVLVGAFALFHGSAHAGEMQDGSALLFALGFTVATLALHGAGIAAGMRLGSASRTATRALGAATALAGLVLAAV